MAENPWEVVEGGPAVVKDNPWAVVEPPSVVEDVAKTAAPSLLRGTLGLLTTPGSVDDLLHKGLEWGVNKVAPDSSFNKFLKDMRGLVTDEKTGKNLTDKGSFFPTYETAKDKAEEKTGPLYEAKTPVGKGVQTGLEVLPSVAGGGVIPAIAKATGAGAVSAGAGEAVKAAGDTLPAWAEPVARGVGALVGTGVPALTRRAVTPNPMSTEQAATVAALRARDPDFPMTAGQATNSPRLMALEGRAPRMEGMPQAQEEAFTRATMREMGSDGLHNPENILRGQQVGDQLGTLRRSNSINQTEFAGLQSAVNNEKRNLIRTAGNDNTQVIDDVIKDLKFGANGKQQVFDMPGGRYEWMRENLQNKIDAASTSKEKIALSNIRKHLDDAFARSLPDDAARDLHNTLTNQYANYNVLKNMKPGFEETVTPKEVLGAVSKNWGAGAANENRGTLAPLARDANQVMKELPKPDVSKVPPSVDLMLSALNGVLHGGAIHAAGGGAHGAIAGLGEGSVVGHLLAPSTYHGVANTAGRLAARPTAQAYLGNQQWLPGAASAAPDREQLIRLLMANPQTSGVASQ